MRVELMDDHAYVIAASPKKI